MNKCIICEKLKHAVVFREFGIDIFKCKNCGHVFSSYNAEQDYEGYYGEKIGGDDHYWWDEAHRKMYNDFCNKFIKDKSGKLLDVGCGFGYFVKKILKYPDWQVYGYEISKLAVDFANNKLNLENIYCGKVENANFKEKYFDIITLWDVIEHIPDPRSMLSYLHKILKDDGILFIHTPNVKIQLLKAKIKMLIKGEKKGGHYMEAKDHVNIYSPDTIRKLLNRYDFKNIKFIHLHPIQSVSGGKGSILRFIKNIWFYFSVFLYKISFGKININNLFIAVKKF